MSSEAWFGLIVTYLIHSTLMLGAGWLVVRLNRSATPGFESCVWKHAAIAGFVTAVAQWTIGETPFTRLSIVTSSWASSDAQPSVSSNVLMLPGEEESKSKWAVSTSLQPIEAPEWDPNLGPSVSAIAESGSGDSQARLSSNAHLVSSWLLEAPPVQTRGMVVALVASWAALGVAWLTLRLLVTHFRVQGMSLSSPERLVRLLNEITRENNLDRPIDLRVDTRSDAEPVALGCFRWTIVLPAGIEDLMADDEIRGVLSHELGHLVRRDYPWKLVGHLLCLCVGFQPLNFLARRRWERASEYLCDQWAAEHGASRIGLAKCLTKLAEQRLEGRAMLVVAATGSKPVLIRRVERLIGETGVADPWQSKARIRFVSALALVAMVSVTLTGPSVRATDPRQPRNADEHVLAPQHTEQSAEVPVVMSRTDDETPIADLESWLGLDAELRGLLSDLGVAEELAVASGRHAKEIEKLRAMATAIEQRRNNIATQLGVGEDQ